jgi:hypothetical protein
VLTTENPDLRQLPLTQIPASSTDTSVVVGRIVWSYCAGKLLSRWFSTAFAYSRGRLSHAGTGHTRRT